MCFGPTKPFCYVFLWDRCHISVDGIYFDDLWNGSKLTEVIFSADSRLRAINGFRRFVLLSRIEIPASVEKIGPNGFSECTGLTEVIFATDSRLRNVNGFCGCTSLCRLEIPASIEKINFNDFSECKWLTEVIFATDGFLRTINGFQNCTLLSRIKIPASVENIDFNAFWNCIGLVEVIFATDGRLRKINGFGRCGSLSRLEIPASVEKIGSFRDYHTPWRGFLGDHSGRELIFESGTRLKRNVKKGCFRGFVDFEDVNDLKRRRREAHL
jgi:hypothetical protein